MTTDKHLAKENSTDEPFVHTAVQENPKDHHGDVDFLPIIGIVALCILISFFLFSTFITIVVASLLVFGTIIAVIFFVALIGMAVMSEGTATKESPIWLKRSSTIKPPTRKPKS